MYGMKKTIMALAIFCLLAHGAAALKVLFYEVDVGSKSMFQEYKNFADEIKKKHEVASIEKGTLTKDKLQNYDILIIPDTQKAMDSEEISSILWFVLQEGKGLLISNAGPTSHHLTIPFGTVSDSGKLIDAANAIPNKDRYNFIIKDFPDNAATRPLRKGVTTIGFYGGNGLEVSGGSKCIAIASPEAYSDTGSYPAGSKPCVASAALFGSGLVVILNDGEVLTNNYLGEYNNKQFSNNIIEWLSIARQPTTEENDTQMLHLTIKSMRLENEKLKQDLTRESQEKTAAVNRVNDLSGELLAKTQELNELQEGMIGPFSRGNWAIIILGVGLLLGSLIYSQKKGSAGPAIKDEDILEELGYELDEQKEGKKEDKLDEELSNL